MCEFALGLAMALEGAYWRCDVVSAFEIPLITMGCCCSFDPSPQDDVRHLHLDRLCSRTCCM